MRGNSAGYSYFQTKNRSQRDWLHALRLKGGEGKVKQVSMNGAIFRVWDNVRLTPASLQSEFCILTSDEQRRQPILESLADRGA